MEWFLIIMASDLVAALISAMVAAAYKRMTKKKRVYSRRRKAPVVDINAVSIRKPRREARINSV